MSSFLEDQIVSLAMFHIISPKTPIKKKKCYLECGRSAYPTSWKLSSNLHCRFYSTAEPESASPIRADLFMFPCPLHSHRALRWHTTIPCTKGAGNLYCITEHLELLPKRSLKEKKWFDKNKVAIINQSYKKSCTKGDKAGLSELQQ